MPLRTDRPARQLWAARFASGILTCAASTRTHPHRPRLPDRSRPRLVSRPPLGPDDVLAVAAVDTPGDAWRPDERGVADRPAGAVEATVGGVRGRGGHHGRFSSAVAGRAGRGARGGRPRG